MVVIKMFPCFLFINILCIHVIVCESFVCMTSLAAKLFCISLSISVLSPPPPSPAQPYPLCLIAMPDCAALRVCHHAPPCSPAAPHRSPHLHLALSLPPRTDLQSSYVTTTPLSLRFTTFTFPCRPFTPAGMPLFLEMRVLPAAAPRRRHLPFRDDLSLVAIPARHRPDLSSCRSTTKQLIMSLCTVFPGQAHTRPCSYIHTEAVMF